MMQWTIWRKIGIAWLICLTASCSTGHDSGKKSSPESVIDSTISGDIERVKSSISAGSNVNEFNDEMGFNPLLLSMSSGIKPEVTELLIRSGANVNAIGRAGTALHMVVRDLATESPIEEEIGLKKIKLLLDGGANPDLPDNSGETVLSIVNGRAGYKLRHAFGIEYGNTAPETVKPTSVANQDGDMKISGSGQMATKSFFLNQGLVRFSLSHTGAGHFSVWLMNSSGENEDLLANDSGSFRGSKAVGVRAGRYLLNIQADGPWTVTISQEV